MQWRGSLAALFIAMGCVSKKGMTVDLNRLILGKSYNSTKVFRTAQHVVQAILLGIVVPLLILLLIWDLTDNPNPVPAVVVIAGLVMLCFFFSYVFVVPDDLTSSATDRTLAIASKIFAYTSRGLTPEAALGASKIILSETIASAICFTDGKQVLASWGEDSAKCPAGTPVVLRTTLNVINSGEQSVRCLDRDGWLLSAPARRYCRTAYRAWALRGHARAVLSPSEQHRYAPDGACLGLCRPHFHAACEL